VLTKSVSNSSDRVQERVLKMQSRRLSTIQDGMTHNSRTDCASTAPAQQKPSACFNSFTHAALVDLEAVDGSDADLALSEEWAKMFVAQAGPSFTNPAASKKGSIADEGCWRDRL
jgi:hypothetical protein